MMCLISTLVALVDLVDRDHLLIKGIEDTILAASDYSEKESLI